jgi:hypothetical protein
MRHCGRCRGRAFTIRLARGASPYRVAGIGSGLMSPVLLAEFFFFGAGPALAAPRTTPPPSGEVVLLRGPQGVGENCPVRWPGAASAAGCRASGCRDGSFVVPGAGLCLPCPRAHSGERPGADTRCDAAPDVRHRRPECGAWVSAMKQGEFICGSFAML